MGVGRGAVDHEAQVVGVTPPPVLARLEGLDQGVFGGREMRGGVAVGGLVAAADMPAGHAHPQVNPAVAGAEALLAAVAAWLHVGNPVEMRTGVSHGACNA